MPLLSTKNFNNDFVLMNLLLAECLSSDAFQGPMQRFKEVSQSD